MDHEETKKNRDIERERQRIESGLCEESALKKLPWRGI